MLAHTFDGEPGNPVLVLAGSLGTDRSMWAPQIPALSERFRVLRYDARGHGESPTPPGPYEIADLAGDVLGLLDAAGVERASVCGLSIGGMGAIWLAANAPERVERVVLCCTSAHLPPAENWAQRAAAVRAAGTTEGIADAVVGRWFTPAFAAKRPDVVAAHRAMLVAADPEGYAACCGAIERMDQRADLARIQAPTLVIGAAGDESIPVEHAERIAAQIPGARLEVLDPGAHLATVERADAVNDLIIDHLDPERHP